MKNKKVLFLTQAAMIAAVYVILTEIFAPISFSVGQVRIAEALTILPAFTPAAIVGLFIGILADYLFGTVWFIAFYSGMHTDAVIEALSVCVLPFILPDVLKLIPAFAVWTKTKSILRP